VPTSLVQFLVPGDLRYTRCDCAEQSPCRHVPLAVWSFRQLAPELHSGIVATGSAAPPVSADLLADLDAALLDLAEQGLGGASSGFRDQLARLEARCRDSELVWPADIVVELLEQYERYGKHDARFSPDRVVELAGELVIRADAIVSDAPPKFSYGVPQPAMPAAPRDYWELAQAATLRGTSLASLGVGQLIMNGGKRLASGKLTLGRGNLAQVQPQKFAWENLRAPALVEDFAELQARLDALPPSSLRPRRVAEDFHVCPIAAVEAVQFVVATQAIHALVRDARGVYAQLFHPYTSRGRRGAEALLAVLGNSAQQLRFVAGPVRRSPRGLIVHPVCLVFERDDQRCAVQPWIEKREADAPQQLEGATEAHPTDPLADFWLQLRAALEEVFVVGLQRLDLDAVKRWREIQRRGEAIGLPRVAEYVARLAGVLEQKAHTLRWEIRAAAQHVLQLALLVRMAQDLLA
jgi:hypothetical protein